MKNFKTSPLLLVFCMSAAGLIGTGCVNTPTEKQSISDLRPQISFKVADDRMLSAHIQLDGLDAGMVADYVDGASAMRIRPGTHLLRIVSGSEVVLEERFYLGDGVNRAFIVR